MVYMWPIVESLQEAASDGIIYTIAVIHVLDMVLIKIRR